MQNNMESIARSVVGTNEATEKKPPRDNAGPSLGQMIWYPVFLGSLGSVENVCPPDMPCEIVEGGKGRYPCIGQFMSFPNFGPTQVYQAFVFALNTSDGSLMQRLETVFPTARFVEANKETVGIILAEIYPLGGKLACMVGYSHVDPKNPEPYVRELLDACPLFRTLVGTTHQLYTHVQCGIFKKMEKRIQLNYMGPSDAPGMTYRGREDFSPARSNFTVLQQEYIDKTKKIEQLKKQIVPHPDFLTAEQVQLNLLKDEANRIFHTLAESGELYNQEFLDAVEDIMS